MDSCHLFNFLFGARKTTTELRKCFTGEPKGGRDGVGRRGGKAARTAPEPLDADGPPSSPLRQIQSRIVNFASAANASAMTRLAPKRPAHANLNADERPQQQQPQQQPTTTFAESGTYKATLVELPLSEDELHDHEHEHDHDHDHEEEEEAEKPTKERPTSPAARLDENNNPIEAEPMTNNFKQRANLYDNPAACEIAQPEREIKTAGQQQQQQQQQQELRYDKMTTSERVRQLVQSFEGPDSALAAAAPGGEPEVAPRSPTKSGRSGSLRRRWPPALDCEQAAAPAPASPKASGKPTTIVKPLPPKTPPKSNRAKCLNLQLTMNKPLRLAQLLQDEHFLRRHFFAALRALDRCAAAQVCRKWRDILYSDPVYWKGLVGVVDCTQLRREHLIECIVSTLQSAKLRQQQQQANGAAITSAAHNGHLKGGAQQAAAASATCREAEEALECLDRDEIWRIQELCNRYARGSLAAVQQQQQQQLASRSTNQTAGPNCADGQINGGGAPLASSKSQCSLPSQVSSTLSSSVSISSLLSPLSESSKVEWMRERLYTALDERGFEALCLFGASDDDIEELASRTRPQRANSRQRLLVGRLENCPLSDRGLELFASTFNQLEELELTGCNELTNGLQLAPLTCLKRLTITDCINIADGLAQRLAQVFHQLEELVLQAYHLTDAFLEFLSLNNDTSRLTRLELPNCKELTNSSMLTIAKHFPNVRALSISGSSRISDDGVELLAEHARQLRRLDLSWCTRITDVSLECLACDLAHSLTELILDRNAHITDTGLGYLAAMSRLELLHIRWCPRLTDAGLHSVLAVRSLRKLSLAGLQQVSARSLLNLVEPNASGQQLEEVELTNCPAVSGDLMQFLRARMPKCNIIF